eukprot:c17525_g1_i1 orf=146-439(+)
MTEETRATTMVVKASMELGAERSDVELPATLDGLLLSDKLVELKRLCMGRLGEYLLRHNAAAGDDPLLQDPVEASDEDDDNDDSEPNSNPPCPKKRK